MAHQSRRAKLDDLTQETLLADENRAVTLHRFTHALDHFPSIGLHQGNPGSLGSGLWIVFRTPIGHFHQDRDEIESLFSRDIFLSALILLRGLFYQNILLLQVSESAGENVGRYPLFRG